MNKYQTAVIYKIISKDPDVKEFYFGSTTNFKQRMRCHKYSCNNSRSKQHNALLYQFIRQNGGFDNFIAYPIEIGFKNKNEMLFKEGELTCIHTLKVINERIAGNLLTRSNNEYHDAYKAINKSKYMCDSCNFSSHIKTVYTNHCNSNKHKRIASINNE